MPYRPQTPRRKEPDPLGVAARTSREGSCPITDFGIWRSMTLSWVVSKRRCTRWRSQGGLPNVHGDQLRVQRQTSAQQLCAPWLSHSGFIFQKVLPTSSGRIAEEPQLILGRVRLFEIGLKRGALPCPILATPTSEPGA